MKKINYTPEFKNRLENASKNGSVIASEILKALKGDKDTEVRGSADYFGTIKTRANFSENHKCSSVKYFYCGKDLDNDNFPDKGNPEAGWLRENRTVCSPSSLITKFINVHTPDSEEEIKYFHSAMGCDEIVDIKIWSSTADIEKAYNESNYASLETSEYCSLHNSCMRCESRSTIVGDFYHNFAGARIMVAVGRNSGDIYGRAIVWDKCYTSIDKDDCFSVVLAV